MREGSRNGEVFRDSGVGLANGDSSSSSEVEPGDCGLAAKSIASIESSRGNLGAGAGGEAMVVPIFYLCGIRGVGRIQAKRDPEEWELEVCDIFAIKNAARSGWFCRC